MTSREHLESYRKALKKDERLREELARLRARWTGGAVQISDMPKAHGGSRDLSEYVAIADKIIEDLEANIGKVAEIRQEILTCLDAMESDDERDALYYHYICLMPWVDVCDKLHFSERYMRTLHHRALCHYVPPADPEE